MSTGISGDAAITIKGLKHALGFTLLEMLVGLILASLVLFGVMQQYVSTLRHYRQTQLIYDEAFDVGFIVELLRDRIRHAGFTPCRNLSHLVTRDQRSDQMSFSGIDVAREGDGQLIIHRMQNEFGRVERVIAPNIVHVSDASGLDPRYPIVVADCFHAEIQMIDSIDEHNVTLKKQLAFSYHQPIFIGEWRTEQFYVQTKKGIPRLFYRYHRSDELSHVVKDMGVNIVRSSRATLVNISLHLKSDKLLRINTWIRS